jgi:membrane-bound lytic murein transglycosylase B
VTHRPLRPDRPHLLLCTLLAATATSAPALDGQRAEVAGFIAEMADRHGFEREALRSLFTQVETRPKIIEAMSRPAEKTMPWHEYRARFLTERRIRRGGEVAREQSVALEAASRASGVPVSVLLAITGVETFYGEITGSHRVIDALATLAFDYPARSRYFRGELEQFLLMTREESLDPLEPLGSYAGAMGIPQFMPTSFRNYAVDGGGDGHRNLWRDWSDVFASVGNYLKLHGWRAGEPVMVAADVSAARLDGLEVRKLDLGETVGSLRERGVRFDSGLPADAPAVLIELAGRAGPEYRVGFTNFHAITRYNRSAMYASAVNDLAESLAEAPACEPPPEAVPAAVAAPPAPAEGQAPRATPVGPASSLTPESTASPAPESDGARAPQPAAASTPQPAAASAPTSAEPAIAAPQGEQPPP